MRAHGATVWPASTAVRMFLAGGLAFLAYALLTGLAPDTVPGDLEALLLGIVNGLVVALGVRLGHRVLPALALGSLLGIVVGFALWDHIDLFLVVIAVLVAAQVTAWVLLIIRSGAVRFRDTGDLARYVAVVVAVSAVGGVLAATASVLGNHAPVDDYFHAWRSWVIDDAFGLICIAPALLTLRRPAAWSWGHAVEWSVAVAYTAISIGYVFFLTDPEKPGLFGFPYLTLLGMIWIAVRLGMAAVAPVLAVGAWAALLGTVQEQAPSPEPLRTCSTESLQRRCSGSCRPSWSSSWPSSATVGAPRSRS